MSEKDILKFLQVLGFSKREIQVYMFLAKSGAQSTSFVAKRLKMERVQAYRTFKKLQEKGFIEATLERPTRFTVVPFESLMNSFIETKKSEIENLNEQKEALMTSWKTLSMPESDYALAKFSVISGKKKIHVKMLNMIDEAQKDVHVLTTGLGVIQEDLGGVFDSVLTAAKKRDMHFRILAEISKENFKIMEHLDKRIRSEKAEIESRHLILSSKYFPRFLIKDDEEAILYASGSDDTSVLNIEDEGLWINDKMFISILKAFFNQMWSVGVDANRRIEEIKTGIPIGETVVIKNPAEAWAKVEQVLDGAKQDVIMITSSQSILTFHDKDPFAKHHKDGVTFRLMAPIDLDNLDAAKALSKKYEIKHVPINYMTMLLVDDRNLFMFKSPPLDDVREESTFYLNDTFFTNDAKSSERVFEMLNDTWKRGAELAEITSQAAGMKLPETSVECTESVSTLVKAILQNSVNSVLITDKEKAIGLINDREVLRELGTNKKDPDKTLVKDLNYTPILTLGENETMTDAFRKIPQIDARRIAVVKNRQLLSMLTQPAKDKRATKSAKT
jgi:sugar-specific transcriptional regulator TrmB/CBS domain-containing protein